jgi:cyanophycinase
LGRLLAAVARKSNLLGIGIDENTAVIVNDQKFEVIGEGAVTVVDLSTVTHSNVEVTLRDEAIALCGITLHVLPSGYGFDLNSRTPIV